MRSESLRVATSGPPALGGGRPTAAPASGAERPLILVGCSYWEPILAAVKQECLRSCAMTRCGLRLS